MPNERTSSHSLCPSTTTSHHQPFNARFTAAAPLPLPLSLTLPLPRPHPHPLPICILVLYLYDVRLYPHVRSLILLDSCTTPAIIHADVVGKRRRFAGRANAQCGHSLSTRGSWDSPAFERLLLRREWCLRYSLCAVRKPPSLIVALPTPSHLLSSTSVCFASFSRLCTFAVLFALPALLTLSART